MQIDIENSFSQIINALSQIIALESNEHISHAWRVAVVATEIARKLIPDTVSYVYYAGLLHDVGIIGFDENVWKNGQVNERTYPEIEGHPNKGAKIVAEIPGLTPSAEIIMDHHECWNGSGFPRHKRSEEINEGAQCLRAADTFDLLLRRYPSRHFSDIIQDMEYYKNKEFSPTVFQAFQEVVSHNMYGVDMYHTDGLQEYIRDIQSSLAGLPLDPRTDAIGTTLRVFAKIIDAKHAYTCGHSQRVSQYSMLIGEALQLEHDQISKIKWASLLHDAGKVAIAKDILNKPGPLTPEEFDIVKKHPVLTGEIIKFIDDFQDLLLVVRHHHERFDGIGYPDALKNEDIPFLSRVITIADAFDAMTSPRPYQKTKSIHEALQELRRLKDKQFDGKIMATAVEVFHALTV